MLLLKRNSEQSLGRGKRECEGSGLFGSNPKVHKEN